MAMAHQSISSRRSLKRAQLPALSHFVVLSHGNFYKSSLRIRTVCHCGSGVQIEFGKIFGKILPLHDDNEKVKERDKLHFSGSITGITRTGKSIRRDRKGSIDKWFKLLPSFHTGPLLFKSLYIRAYTTRSELFPELYVTRLPPNFVLESGRGGGVSKLQAD